MTSIKKYATKQRAHVARPIPIPKSARQPDISNALRPARSDRHATR